MAFILSIILFFIFVVPSYAQDATPSATPTDTPSSTPTVAQPSTTPTPTITQTPAPSTTPTPQESAQTSSETTPTPATGGTSQKEEVLGEKTSVLGKTDSGREIGKWLVAGFVGFVVLLAGIRISRMHVEE